LHALFAKRAYAGRDGTGQKKKISGSNGGQRTISDPVLSLATPNKKEGRAAL
jgi:hypothetical protein